MTVKRWIKLATLGAQLALGACGGGGDDDDSGARHGPSDGGTSGADGGLDCGLCAEMECMAEMQACVGDTACQATLQCSDSCEDNDWTCVDRCASANSGGGTNRNPTFQDFLGCVGTRCKAACGL